MLIKMNLKGNFPKVPEGERILEITNAECRPSGKPTRLEVTFKDSEGATLVNRYDFERGAYQMGMLCSIALGLHDGDDFDTVKDTPRLVGKKVLCEVVHNKGTKPNENGEFPTFVNIKKVISLVDEETGEVEDLSPRNMISNQTYDDLD